VVADFGEGHIQYMSLYSTRDKKNLAVYIVIHATLLSVETNKRQNESFISQFATQALNKYRVCDDSFY